MMRSKKSRHEILLMKNVQKVTEKAMGLAVSLIRNASVKKGILYIDRKPLTAEQVKFSMHSLLLQHGCSCGGYHRFMRGGNRNTSHDRDWAT